MEPGQLVLRVSISLVLSASPAIAGETIGQSPPLLRWVGIGHESGPVDLPSVLPGAKRLVEPARLWTSGVFTSVQVNVDASGNNVVGDAANETSIAVDPTIPNRLAIGWRQFDSVSSNFRQAGIGFSTDGGRTWTAGNLEPGVFRSDPVLGVSSDGRFFYDSLRYIEEPETLWCEIAMSPNGGADWSTFRPAAGGDKQWLAVDRTGGVGEGHLYQSWDADFGCCGDTGFSRSTDGGASFEPSIGIPERPKWGTSAVGPSGTLFIAGTRADSFFVARSTTVEDPTATPAFDSATTVDLGGSVVAGIEPNPVGLLGQIWVATDHSGGPTHGNVYVLASVDPSGDDPLDVHFSRSTDGGTTWSPPVRVNDDSGNDLQWFGTMSVAPNGRIDVVWNDTRGDPGGLESRLYYAFSNDAGATWSANVAVSPAFDPTLGRPNQDKIGDYYQIISDNVGAHVAFAATFNGEQDVFYLRIGDYDCNGNGISDTVDIINQTSLDLNLNDIPDECEALLFDDGFELGSTATWSATSGGTAPPRKPTAGRSKVIGLSP